MYLMNDNYVIFGLTLIIGSALILLGIKVMLKHFNKKGGVKQMEKNEKGFTLIELITVVAIIGILATIAVTQFSSYRERAFDADTKTVLRTATLEQEAHFTDHGSYTTTPDSVANNPQISFNITIGTESYHIEAKHNNSNNWYVVDGPGGFPRTL